MSAEAFRLSYLECRALLHRRLAEPAPGRIQLLSGPRQVGKTTLVLELVKNYGDAAIYAAADAPEAALPGFWERLWSRAEEIAVSKGRALVVLDETHLLSGWAPLLKGQWDRIRRLKLPIHIVATGSSALRLAAGSRESLAGRFERITLTHWHATALAAAFQLEPPDCAEFLVRQGSYPGAMIFRSDAVRWSAYVREGILEPAIGRDILSLAPVRKPGLLRQVFAICASSPAQIVSLQKLQGQLQDRGALETIAHYLALLEEAFLVATLRNFSLRMARSRATPPKLVTLSNALLAVVDPQGIPDPTGDASRFGAWVENACLAHAWICGQQVRYWREEPFEVDGIIDGDWGAWAIEIKSGTSRAGDLRGLAEFTRRHPKYRPLLICDVAGKSAAARLGIEAVTWQDYLLYGLPGALTQK